MTIREDVKFCLAIEDVLQSFNKMADQCHYKLRDSSQCYHPTSISANFALCRIWDCPLLYTPPPKK
jgi:hypothetical protein